MLLAKGISDFVLAFEMENVDWSPDIFEKVVILTQDMALQLAVIVEENVIWFVWTAEYSLDKVLHYER